MKIRPLGDKFFSAARRTDMTKLVVTVRNFSKALKTSQLMLYREIIAVCSQIHRKHINTLYGQNVELLSVKPGGTNNDHWALKA